MAASRMSRIANCRLAALFCIVTTLTYVLSDQISPDHAEDAEIIAAPKIVNVHAIVDDGTAVVSSSASDFKKPASNKKFQKYYPKSEVDWNFKEEGKKSDIFIKDAKDNRLLRIISEGLLNPQDTLPTFSNDAIYNSSQKNDSIDEINVNVQSEGMSGIVNDGLPMDSDERLIMEKKINAAKERLSTKSELGGTNNSKESDEDIKINLDASTGVQKPLFNKQKDSIAVPPQKQISLSKGKESHTLKKHVHPETTYDVIPLTKHVPGKFNNDDGAFDFVDSPLSDKHLISAGTAQTSRINVKKGPNGQDYEYEYIYYYYEDDNDPAVQNNGNKVQKSNEIPASVSTAASTVKTTLPPLRTSSTPLPNRNTKQYVDETLPTRVKPVDVLSEEVTIQPQQNRDKFRYSVDNSLSQQSNKNSASNDYYNQLQYNSARYPGRQVIPQTVSEQPTVTVPEETQPTSIKQFSRGRTHFNTITDDSTFIDTTLPVSTQQTNAPTRSKFTTGSIRQPGLDLVDNNSFRTHSTSIPVDYEKVYPSSQTLENQSKIQSQPVVSSSTKSNELLHKDQNFEHTANTERTTALPTRNIQFYSSNQPTETIVDNTAPFLALSENSLTTIHGTGLTDKAAHDLYAIYQQTRNEESRNFITQDDHITTNDDNQNTFLPVNPTVATVFPSSTTVITTTVTTPSTTTTTTTAPVTSASTGRGRFRSTGVNRSKPVTQSTTDTANSATSESTNTENTEKPRSKFQPSHRRDPNKISAYGRRGSSTTTASEYESSTEAKSWSGPSKRYRGGSSRSETTPSITENYSTHARPSIAERYNSRRRNGGVKSTTIIATTEEETVSKQDNVESNNSDQQSTTYRSVRNKLHQNSQIRPLRPGAKLNLSPKSKVASTSTTTAPLDDELNGNADVLPEQQQASAENHEQEDISEVNTSSSSTTIVTTPPDTLTRLRNRPKLRITERAGNHAKVQAQQATSSAALNQNRRQLVNNLLPRKKQQPTSTTETLEEKLESSKPVTEELNEEPAPKSDIDVSETVPLSEVSSTTENKLNSLLTSRRRNLSGRKPGTLHNNRQTTANDSS